MEEETRENFRINTAWRAGGAGGAWDYRDSSV